MSNLFAYDASLLPVAPGLGVADAFPGIVDR